MADFKIAYNLTNVNEGAWVNDPLDKGGETYGGISRKNFPNWPGWAIIDAYEKQPNFPSSLSKDSKLEEMKEAFYFAYFWVPIKGSFINPQPIANMIYDSAVNIGVEQAIKMAQRTVGTEQTGKMDQLTIDKINNKI